MNADHEKQPLARKNAPARSTVGFASPRNALFENEQFIVHHFCESLTYLLSFRSHDSNNAFCTHLLPLAQSSSLVLGAIEAISTAHLSMLGSRPVIEAGEVHTKSLRLLSDQLSSETLSSCSAEAVLSATLFMVYYEVRALLSSDALC